MLDKGKKYGSAIFFIGNPNIKFQNPGSLDMACTKKLDERTNGQMDKRRQIICPINFIRNWGHNQVIYSSLPIYSSSFKVPATIIF